MKNKNNQDADPARKLLNEIGRQSSGMIKRAGAIASFAAVLWVGQAVFASELLGALIAGNVTNIHIAVSVAGFVVLGLLRHLGDNWAGRIAFLEAQRMVADRRAAIVRAQGLVSPFAPGRQSSASLATLAGAKLDQLAPWMTRYRIASIKVSVVPVILLLAVAPVSWVAALVLAVAGPLIPVFMALIGFAARDASEKHMAETGTLNAMLLEWLNAGPDIRILNAGAETVDRFDVAAESLRVRTMAVLKIAFLSSTVLEIFAALGIAMVAVYIGFTLLGTFSFGTWGNPLTAAKGIFILLLVPDYFMPLRELAAAWHDRAAALAVAGEIADLEAQAMMPIVGKGAKAAPLAGPATLSTSSLVYETPAGKLIRFPDFEIKPGEKIAISGASGAGKSTLIGLLTGLVKQAEGSIQVCGTELNDDSADAWRQRFAYIGQHPHMLNASLRANIAFSGGVADPAKLSQAIDLAGARDIVAALPRGLDSRLGENGSGVSGGEARRLTIARAIYAEADVIFADEPTADLDAETAQLIADALIAASRTGATLIVATHDEKLAQLMDRRIVLEAGA